MLFSLGLTLVSVTFAAPLPTITVSADDTRITESCRIVIPPGQVIADENGDGVLHVAASDITITFADSAHLRGSPPDADPDTYEGFGLRIRDQQNVTVRGARLSGFRAGLFATNADGLTLEEIDASDHRRARLYSTRLVEAGRDWIRPHDNDDNEWLSRYAAALYIEDSDNLTIRRNKVWHSQNALCLDRVNDSRIYDNDFSFNSGWGIALWRSSRNVITRNAADFCVRGYSHHVYNRGQDSAGILAFEQNNDNIIAENSATHGGDGFFGFAGREALGQRGRNENETPEEAEQRALTIARRVGNNHNLLIANDFSYAPAHGIENTFSFGNRFLNNRLVENAICGVWGGYSQDTLIAGNHFARNGDMGYGLERGGVNIEFGRHNRIINNEFVENYCGIHLWWVRRGSGPANLWSRTHLRDFDDNLIANNSFTRDQLALDFRGDGEIILADNTLTNVEEPIRRLGAPRIIHATTPISPAVTTPDYPVFGQTRPVGARSHLRGRDQIIMTAWGPWDHTSPLVRQTRFAGPRHVYQIHHLPAAPQIDLDAASDVRFQLASATTEPARDTATPRLSLIATAPGAFPYTLNIAAGDFREQVTGTLLNTTWQVTTFPFDGAPPADLASILDADTHSPAETEHFELDALELIRRLPGDPEDIRASHRPRSRHHRVALRATTTVPMPAGRWQVEVVCDEAVRLTVADERVIDEWRRRWMPRRYTAIITRDEAGPLPIVLDHFQIGRKAILSFQVTPAPAD